MELDGSIGVTSLQRSRSKQSLFNTTILARKEEGEIE